jgi:chemotaxis protein MotB
VRVSSLAVARFCALVLVAALSSSACVSKVHYDRCVSDAAQAHAEAEAKEKDDASRIQGLVRDLAAAQATIQDRDSKLSELSTANHNVQAQLDEATAIHQQLRTELSRLGKDVDKMLSERGTLSKALDDAKTRLDELRKAQAVAQSRVDLFRTLAGRFKPLLDAGQMRIETRRGQPVMEVSSELLFDAGRSELRPAGKGALMEVAHALQAAAAGGARRFLVTSHVDPPEGKARSSKSTWDLTSARSVSVVEYLVSLGMPAPSLTAAAGGSFDPVAPNDTPEGRARNRRVEIALWPLESDVPPAAPPTP